MAETVRRNATAGKGPRRRTKGLVGSTRVRDRARLSEKMSHRTRTRLFIESTIPDFLLVLLVSVTLTFTVSFGFHSAWDHRGNVALIALITIPLLVAMFVGSWSKRALLPSIVATVVLGVAVIAVAMAVSPEPLFTDAGLNDVDGSYGIFAMVAVIVPVLVFLLSRRPVGLVFLLLGAVIACGLIQFLYREWISEQPGIAATVVMLFGIGMMFVYQSYKQSIYSANRVKRTSFTGAFGFSALVGAACVLVGVAVFYGAVAVTDWQTPEVKLFESYVSPPPSDQARDYQKMPDGGDTTSDNSEDQNQEQDPETANGDDADMQSGQGMLQNSIVGRFAMQLAGIDPQDDENNEDVPQEDWHLAAQIMGIILTVLAVLVVVTFVLLWRYRRTWRLRRMAKRSNAYQACYLYLFLLERFRRMKIRKPRQLTPLEFAVGFSKAMLPYTRDTGGVDFVEVSSLYQDVAFGAYEPTDGELDRVKRYYQAFYRNAFKATAWPKWVLCRFWRL